MKKILLGLVMSTFVICAFNPGTAQSAGGGGHNVGTQTPSAQMVCEQYRRENAMRGDWLNDLYAQLESADPVNDGDEIDYLEALIEEIWAEIEFFWLLILLNCP